MARLLKAISTKVHEKLFDLMKPATDDGLAPVKLVRGS